MNELAALGTALVIASYALSVWRKEPYIFHLGNLTGGPMLVASGIAMQAYAHATLSATFMAVAAVGAVQEWCRRG